VEVVGAEVVAVDAVVVDVSKIAVRPPIQTPIKGDITLGCYHSVKRAISLNLVFMGNQDVIGILKS